MKNTYFRFKQFIIHQEKTSMKVCTDSCLFGAWIALMLEEKKLAAKNILDIGTGTGLLSLMLAQKTDAAIDAIEINKLSFEEATTNFSESKWASQLQAHHSDIKNYRSGTQYDFIISNPPFFENDLLSRHPEKNIAKHQAGLTLENLLNAVTTLSESEGHFAVLLPYHRVDHFIVSAAENGLILQESVFVKQTPRHSFFRGMLLFGWKQATVSQKELTIKDIDDNYSEELINLLSDYYLNL